MRHLCSDLLSFLHPWTIWDFVLLLLVVVLGLGFFFLQRPGKKIRSLLLFLSLFKL